MIEINSTQNLMDVIINICALQQYNFTIQACIHINIFSIDNCPSFSVSYLHWIGVGIKWWYNKKEYQQNKLIKM